MPDISVPVSRYTFQLEPAILPASEEVEAGEQEDDGSDDLFDFEDDKVGGGRAPYQPRLMLQHLELKAMLKPSVDVRDVLKLAGSILGVDPTTISKQQCEFLNKYLEQSDGEA